MCAVWRGAGYDRAVSRTRDVLAAGEPSHIRFQQAAAEDLPFASARFDLVFSTLTFHHWADQSKAVAEIGRVLAPGGRWLLADFLATGLMRQVRRLLRMNRFPEREALSAMLAPAGLRVLRERKVLGLHGQVAVLAIGRQD